jgi:hypothetical protein
VRMLHMNEYCTILSHTWRTQKVLGPSSLVMDLSQAAEDMMFFPITARREKPTLETIAETNCTVPSDKHVNEGLIILFRLALPVKKKIAEGCVHVILRKLIGLESAAGVCKTTAKVRMYKAVPEPC